MTAIVTELATRRRLAPPPSSGPRPALISIEGGRGATASRRRAVYLRRRLLAVVLLAVLGYAGVQLGTATLHVLFEAEAPAGHASGLQLSGGRYVVQPGDTMWDIARGLGSGDDVRAVVDRLVAMNGAATVRVGQEIRIPSDLAPRS